VSEPLARCGISSATFPAVRRPLPLKGKGRFPDASTPLADHDAGEFGQGRAEGVRLRQPFNRQQRVTGPCDQAARHAGRLAADRVSHMRRNHAAIGEGHVQVLRYAVVHRLVRLVGPASLDVVLLLEDV
jgi:hypothetical protein